MPTACLRVRFRSPALSAGDVAAAIRSVHPRLTIEDVRPMSELFAQAVAPQRLHALLLLLLAGVALVLTTVGLYALVAQTVAQRIREIGIRLALGARWEQLLGLVLGEGLLDPLDSVRVHC